jgi:hypothetical protein
VVKIISCNVFDAFTAKRVICLRILKLQKPLAIKFIGAANANSVNGKRNDNASGAFMPGWSNTRKSRLVKVAAFAIIAFSLFIIVPAPRNYKTSRIWPGAAGL